MTELESKKRDILILDRLLADRRDFAIEADMAGADSITRLHNKQECLKAWQAREVAKNELLQLKAVL